MHAQLLSHVQLFCELMYYSPPSSSVHGILQAKILELVAMPSSNDLLNAGMEPTSPASPELAGGFSTTRATWHVGSSSLIRDGTWAA